VIGYAGTTNVVPVVLTSCHGSSQSSTQVPETLSLRELYTPTE